MAENAVQMQSITKSYSGVTVLKGVDFILKRGEIQALLGENGAGKTTLMNILGGVTPKDSGKIALFNEPVKIHSPADAQSLGIAFIHQELNLVNDLTVYENMFLGNELFNKYGLLDKKRMCEKTTEVFDRMNVSIDPRTMVSELDMSSKQIVEIGRSLLSNAKIIIMDEPTTSLNREEIEIVFSIMEKLTKEQNVAIIFISHKLDEVVEFCNSYTVLRNGEKISDGPIIQEDGSKIEQSALARMLVGNETFEENTLGEHDIGEVILEVKNLNVENHVSDLSFKLHKGEILGITGLLGDGKEELAQALFGNVDYTGEIIKDGQPLKLKHPSQAKSNGIGYLPPNRKENAIIKDLSVRENITIAAIQKILKRGIIDYKEEYKVSQNYRDRLHIKTSDLSNKITSLSGGNQQKAVLAKWLYSKPDIMILSNPTQGIDVGAKNEMYQEIAELAEKGMGVIVTSGEAQEVMRICDRIIVMYHGNFRGELNREEFAEDDIMILSTGGGLGDGSEDGLNSSMGENVNE